MLTLSPAGTEPCSQKNEESERRKHVAWLRKAFSNRFSAAYIATDSTFVVALCPPQGFLKVGHANLNVNLEGTTAVWCHAGLPTECCLSPFPQAMPLNIISTYISQEISNKEQTDTWHCTLLRDLESHPSLWAARCLWHRCQCPEQHPHIFMLRSNLAIYSTLCNLTTYLVAMRVSRSINSIFITMHCVDPAWATRWQMPRHQCPFALALKKGSNRAPLYPYVFCVYNAKLNVIWSVKDWRLETSENHAKSIDPRNQSGTTQPDFNHPGAKQMRSTSVTCM